MKSTIYYQYYDSPVGKLLLIANDKGLIGIEFEQEQLTSDAQKWQEANETSGQIFEIFCKTRDILDRYFAGEKLEFRHLDFLAPQGTEF